MTNKSICLAFEVHQPFRLRKDFFWNKRMFKRSVKSSSTITSSVKKIERYLRRLRENAIAPRMR